MRRREWTSEEVRTLREMLIERATAKEIGKELGRTVGSIAGKINRSSDINGTEGRPPNINRLMWVMDMIESGLTLREISLRLGQSPTPVKRLAKKLYKDGLIERTGPLNCIKYVVSAKWKDKD